MSDNAEIDGILSALERAHASLNTALRDGNNGALCALNAEVKRLEREREKVIRARTTSVLALMSVPPARARLVAALQVAARPASGRLLADIARARFGYEVDTRTFASLRRDELRSWRAYTEHPDRAIAKPDLVVPALAFDRFTPERGTLALSSWDLATRMVAPASGRVDVLIIACNLARLCLQTPADPWAADVARVAGRIGLSLPPFAGSLITPTPAQVLEAATQELSVIEPSDQRERRESAERARSLDDVSRLFGAPALGVVSRAGRASV